MKRDMKRIIVCTLLMVLAPAVMADVLLIERSQVMAGMDLPQKSTTMNQVRSQYGDPISESGPVGNPPITKWEYADFFVYFEHQHVITSVLKKSKDTEQGVKPAQ